MIVESLWMTLKRNSLRRHPRASLERFGDILMNDFLIKRVRQITTLRRHLLQAPWYREFRQVWAKAVESIEVADRAYEGELQQDGDFLLIRDRETYGTNLHTWWCRCPAYRQSAYHLCKHLVRLYVDSTSTRHNNIRPNFGSVWHQSSLPLLWIKGLHADDCRNVWPITRTGAPLTDQSFGEDELRLEPTVQESDSEDEGEGDSEGNMSSAEDSEDLEWECQDETALAATELREHGEAKLEAIATMKEQLMAQVQFLEKIGRCNPDDAHFDELPPVGVNHIRAWEAAWKRYEGLQRSRTLPPTFGGVRTGNVFAPM